MHRMLHCWSHGRGIWRCVCEPFLGRCGKMDVWEKETPQLATERKRYVHSLEVSVKFAMPYSSVCSSDTIRWRSATTRTILSSHWHPTTTTFLCLPSLNKVHVTACGVANWLWTGRPFSQRTNPGGGAGSPPCPQQTSFINLPPHTHTHRSTDSRYCCARQRIFEVFPRPYQNRKAPSQPYSLPRGW